MTTSFDIYARMDSPTGKVFVTIGIVAFGLFCAGSLVEMPALSLAAFGPVVFAWLVLFPASLVVGADGFLLKTKVAPRFISWREVERVDYFPGGVSVWLLGGEVLHIPFSQRAHAARSERLEVVEAASAMQAWHAKFGREPLPAIDSLLSLGARSAPNGTFRDAPLREENLWRVAEGADVEPAARAAAALTLARDEVHRPRLRVAASATAAPAVRVVLERAAEGEDVTSSLDSRSERRA